MAHRFLLILVFLCAGAATADVAADWGGHAKFRLIGQTFPDDSLFRTAAGANSADIEGDLRLQFSASNGGWSFDADYQLLALYGDSVEWTRDPGTAAGQFLGRLPDDDRRLFDLTHVIRDDGDTALLQRLDRFAVSYTSEKAVVRFGRQALSWGNGLFYSPMDLVNPFDPAAIDTEFKAGDDMLYLQYLRDNGDDVQGAVVWRRDPLSGNVESDQASTMLKYHRFTNDREFDLLVGKSYGDTVIGFGGVQSLGGAIWRADIVASDTDDDLRVQIVTNLSYSWIWNGRNVSGAIEYYFNGFGQHEDEYDPLSLAANPELVERLARGELFALGRNYVAGSVLVELSPLWSVTPTILANIGDSSALLQLVTRYSLADNMTFLGSINVPVGSNGTEFGGVDAGTPGTYLSTGASLFAQLAWYF